MVLNIGTRRRGVRRLRRPLRRSRYAVQCRKRPKDLRRADRAVGTFFQRIPPRKGKCCRAHRSLFFRREHLARCCPFRRTPGDRSIADSKCRRRRYRRAGCSQRVLPDPPGLLCRPSLLSERRPHRLTRQRDLRCCSPRRRRVPSSQPTPWPRRFEGASCVRP